MKKLTTKEFIDRANEIHNNKYNYSKTNYVNNSTKVAIICGEHGVFSQRPNCHLNGHGCCKCGGTDKLSKKKFITKAKKIHYNKFNYLKVNLLNNKTKVIIICKNHGDFLQTPNDHLNGHGCPKCSKNIKLNTQKFIDKANKIHNNIYNYDLVNYINAHSKVKIICKNHGYFFQMPYSHLNGNGCAKCSGTIKKTNQEFIDKANKIHDNKYNYNLVNYINAHSKVKIICKNHGYFFQTPNKHLNNRGCPKCKNKISKPEIKWLNKLNIKKENRQISLPKLSNYIKVDGYDPKTKTVYEFLGSYYHGDPIKFDLNDYNKKLKKTFKQLYEKTINREIKIRKAGYNYQFVWENDWKNNE